ncbi:hypothetical protein NDU88_008091 [Pleurodeles waltl]|uniref:Uncharacterized protein n=1 Tax=Pleurodeles waltl TaxID=8319 RepID=A0AAV7PVM6_PLEWA|nr:hypothetical protein NDU88_008091 [Pleurodeles waltl]
MPPVPGVFPVGCPPRSECLYPAAADACSAWPPYRSSQFEESFPQCVPPLPLHDPPRFCSAAVRVAGSPSSPVDVAPPPPSTGVRAPGRSAGSSPAAHGVPAPGWPHQPASAQFQPRQGALISAAMLVSVPIGLRRAPEA